MLQGLQSAAVEQPDEREDMSAVPSSLFGMGEAEVDLTFTDTLNVEFHAFGRDREVKRVYWRGIDVTQALEPAELEKITEAIYAQ